MNLGPHILLLRTSARVTKEKGLFGATGVYLFRSRVLYSDDRRETDFPRRKLDNFPEKDKTFLVSRGTSKYDKVPPDKETTYDFCFLCVVAANAHTGDYLRLSETVPNRVTYDSCDTPTTPRPSNSRVAMYYPSSAPT